MGQRAGVPRVQLEHLVSIEPYADGSSPFEQRTCKLAWAVRTHSDPHRPIVH
jgi:hypothetical protein